MGKISGVVTEGAVPVENARVYVVEDTATGSQIVGATLTDASGEYSFINEKLLVTKQYHVMCQHIDGALDEFHALSYPFITPVPSADPDNFEMLTILGWRESPYAQAWSVTAIDKPA